MGPGQGGAPTHEPQDIHHYTIGSEVRNGACVNPEKLISTYFCSVLYLCGAGTQAQSMLGRGKHFQLTVALAARLLFKICVFLKKI
jgi:hypothetical protein